MGVVAYRNRRKRGCADIREQVGRLGKEVKSELVGHFEEKRGNDLEHATESNKSEKKWT